MRPTPEPAPPPPTARLVVRAAVLAVAALLLPGAARAQEPITPVAAPELDGGTAWINTGKPLKLKDLRHASGEGTELFFITGADALAQIFSWRNAEELFALAHFIGCTRPGHTLSDPGFPDGGVSLVEVPALAISSTDIRRRQHGGEPVWYLVPDGVVQYISKRGLYRGAT